MTFISANLWVSGNGHSSTSHLCWFSFEKNHPGASIQSFRSVSLKQALLPFQTLSVLAHDSLLGSPPLHPCAKITVHQIVEDSMSELQCDTQYIIRWFIVVL